MFYIYEWYNTKNNEVFYVGKGTGKRFKDLYHRNKKFQDYYDNNNCDVRIVEYFEDEDKCFEMEKLLIAKYREIGQAIANLDDGGKGGCNFVWTQQMREYQSIYNPMKRPEQRQRMSKNNPMKNPEVAERVGKKHRRHVVIRSQYFDGVKIAAEELGVAEITISKWCKRGYDTDGNPCRYADEEQKECPTWKKANPRAKSKSVIIDETHLFYSVKDAALYCAGNSSSLVRALKENRTYKGHTCKYANQQPS